MKRWWLCLLLAPLAAAADERILSLDSEILVQADGELQVTETIRVRAEGRQIRRGIYRDFPTRYRDRSGNDVQVRFEPLTVMRNDRLEDFHTENLANGVRTYFGSADRMLDSGVHTYTFRYRAGRMLGFFPDYDELYWNATGNGWAFPIDAATASVAFEFEVAPGDIRQHAYTGPFGSAGEDYRASIDSAGAVRFATTRILNPGEGLTIAVGWPKGLVAAPTALEKTGWLLGDNVNLLIAVAGLLGMLAYYVPAWRNFGKDPEPGVIMTRYEPPQGFSPASLRYIEKMYYDNVALTAAVVSLAVKGYLRIVKDRKRHTLVREKNDAGKPELATGERALLSALFAGGDELILDDKYHERIGGARTAHSNSLRRDYRQRYFRTNALLNLPAIAIGVVSMIFALKVGSGPTPFVLAAIGAMGLTLAVFVWLMRAPTLQGRRVLDEASGFREYLEIAEKDEMNLRNPPEKTPALFEAYLPFALAMGVEQEWAERFASVFAKIDGPGRQGYHPSWYNGSWNNFDMGRTAKSLSSSLGSAISSSVSPPGSSSGSGGGGSSGGGGGGGGGGGW